MKPRIKSMIWNIKAQKTPNQNRKKSIQKNECGISSLWENFKHTNIHIMGMPEEEEKEQEIGNIFGGIMKENFPNFVKEIESRKHRVPNRMNLKSPTPRHIIMKMP